MKYVNERGERVEICVRTRMDYGNEVSYIVSDILVTPPRKRKPSSFAEKIRDHYAYRSTPYEQRGEYVQQEFLKICSQEQIDQAVHEAYEELNEKIRPGKAKVEYRVY